MLGLNIEYIKSTRTNNKRISKETEITYIVHDYYINI